MKLYGYGTFVPYQFAFETLTIEMQTAYYVLTVRNVGNEAKLFKTKQCCLIKVGITTLLSLALACVITLSPLYPNPALVELRHLSSVDENSWDWKQKGCGVSKTSKLH